ncbi:LuxR C-terminal-related transcriptional regulator, partial [Ilumatobacter sp.]|uniref:LuxR C-terminal-related transcriptional regulator n=1 Tax=Ilumatobacter sp. TaxID=1967498 RepID=UPI003C4DB4EC
SCRIVSIAAPAGYGKTTLLAEWAILEVRPVGWVSLARADNDPVNLISALAAAFGDTQGLGADFRDAMSSSGASVLGQLGPRLAERMNTADRDFVMILDDLHELTSLECGDLVDLLVDRIPPGSTMVIAGRNEARRLPSWRVSHDVLELGVDDLSFDLDESGRFLRQGDAAMEQQKVVELYNDLEGWVAGLQLALVVARRGTLTSFGRGDRYVVDYLRREVLDGLTADDRHFLTRTSVLEELSGPLCDALLGSDGSASRLHSLEQANLFLIPTDRQRTRYRYHAAFRELLLAELDRTDDGEERRRLHLLASEWYDAQGSIESAVEHALQSANPQRTARLMARVIQDVHARGRLTTIQRWLHDLGDESIVEYPPLAAIAGWIAALAGDGPQAERWADRLGDLSFDGAPTDGSASFDSARAMFLALSCSAGPEKMLADAGTAMDEEPAWGPWRPTAEAMCAEAVHLRGDDGDPSTAWSLFGDAIESAQAAGLADTIVHCRGERALIAMDRNDWAAAREELSLAHELIEANQMREYLTSLISHGARARLALHDGDRAATERYLAMAMRARGTSSYTVPFWAVRLRLLLARIHVTMGEPVTARHLLREVDDVLRKRPALGSLVVQTDELRTMLLSAPAEGGPVPLTPAELRVLPYLQTHLSLQEIATRLFLSRNTVATHAGAIYRKLAATSRSEAVATATSLGLLGDFTF